MEVRESLASVSSQLARGASDLAQQLASPPAAPAYLDLIRCAQVTQELAQQVLERCVQQSRDAGHTWQEIGDLLGVTRQAAVRGSENQIAPRTGNSMEKSVRRPDAPDPLDRGLTSY